MKKLALALVLVTATVAAWRMRHSDAPDPKLFFDHFWVDHEPRGIRDPYLTLFVSGEHPFGNFSTRTIWTGQWEGFHYHVLPREDGALEMLFPNTSERQRVTYAAHRCDENGFDLCLEISGASRGAHRYYSKKEWEGQAGELNALGDAALPVLERR